jgi:hypothetical protein
MNMKSITRITRIAALLVALLTFHSHAAATTTLPLNTGYNHPIWTPYSPVGVQDNYWINIASYSPTSPPPSPAPSFVIPWSGWAPPLPGSGWISARNTRNSAPGTSQYDPAYTLFRKCFCLLPGFKEARLKFSARADDSIEVWLNTHLNKVLSASYGNFNPTDPPLSAGTDKGFRVGKNCLYALVEDKGGAMGFNLAGDVSAMGLLSMPAAGVAQSFAPCACRTGHPGLLDSADQRDTAVAGRQAQPDEDDREVVTAIIKIAEGRRLQRQRERR